MNYAAAICHFPKITLVRARNLLTRFSEPKNAFYAEIDDLVAVGFDETVAHEFITWRDETNVEKITEDLVALGIKTVSIFEPDYPELLKEITDPPPVLFYRGILPKDISPAVSVVGTRRCSIYGKQITRELSEGLAKNGVTIVSGLALGIDGIAHEAALAAGGRTIAVLGSAVDRRHVYPSSHQPLAERLIASGGAVVSEYPPGFLPTLYSFPARNRIIAGLSLGTIVTEAPLSSGALITAERCLDYNRDIFSVPHPATSVQGAGCNELLKKGAMLVTSFEDVLNALEITKSFRETGPAEKQPPKASDPSEELIFSVLSQGPCHIDELMRLTGIKSHNLTAKLTILEMNGVIRNTGAMTYILA